jgi:hypothetical protein
MLDISVVDADVPTGQRNLDSAAQCHTGIHERAIAIRPSPADFQDHRLVRFSQTGLARRRQRQRRRSHGAERVAHDQRVRSAEVRPFFARVVLRLGDAGRIFARGLPALTRKPRDVRSRAAVWGIVDIIRALIRGAPIYEYAPWLLPLYDYVNGFLTVLVALGGATLSGRF